MSKIKVRDLRTPAQTTSLLAVALLGVLLMSGCGPSAFVATATVQAVPAPGVTTIPAKVDILLAEDDTGSMSEAYNQVAAQMPHFLTQLQTMGWDYHFATVPLTTNRPFYQVVGSNYDPNWGSQWVAPNPGATISNTEEINPSFFSTPTNYNGFLLPGDVSLADGGFEPAFSNIAYELYDKTLNTGFLRKDAMLVVLVIGNGNDTSNVNFCVRQPDGVLVPCEDATLPNGSAYPDCTSMSQAGVANPTCGSQQVSLQFYESELTSLKTDPALVQFYSLVSNETTDPCMGGYAQQGVRYQQMSAALGGQSYDLCNGGSLSQSLNDMATSLQSVSLSFQTEYLPIAQAADPTTIVVTRNDGFVIPQDPNNGWSYSGTVTTGYIIDYPVQLDAFTGYAIRLNGTSRLTGGQSATVTYTPLGLHSTN